MVGLFCLATRRGPGGAEKGESMTTICVDVMGADKEPEVPVSYTHLTLPTIVPV